MADDWEDLESEINKCWHFADAQTRGRNGVSADTAFAAIRKHATRAMYITWQMRYNKPCPPIDPLSPQAWVGERG